MEKRWYVDTETGKRLVNIDLDDSYGIRFVKCSCGYQEVRRDGDSLVCGKCGKRFISESAFEDKDIKEILEEPAEVPREDPEANLTKEIQPKTHQIAPESAQSDEPKETALQIAARDYKKQGFRVVPAYLKLKNGRKVVEIPSWKSRDYQPKDFTPKYNAIAIKTGKGSNLFVVDLDKEGVLESHKVTGLGEIPRVLTQGGGSHLYFAYPTELAQKIDLTRSKKTEGIDLRADGGLVFAPPSKVEGGGKYEWLVPIEGELPKLPKRLENLLVKLFPKTPEVTELPVETGKPSPAQSGVWVKEVEKYLQKYPESEDRSGLDYHIAVIGFEFRIQRKEIVKTLKTPDNAKCKDRGHGDDYIQKLLVSAAKEARIEDTDDGFRSVAESRKAAPSEPKLAFLGKGLLPVEEVLTVAGKSTVGKTTLVVQAGLCLAHKQKFMDYFPVERKARMLILTRESNREAFNKLIADQRRALQIPDEAEEMLNVKWTRFCHLSNKAGCEFIKRYIRKYPAEVIVLDPLEFFVQGDINKMSTARDAFVRLKDLMGEFHCSFILITHTRKDNPNPRMTQDVFDCVIGTSGFRAFSGSLLVLVQESETKAATLKRLHCEFRYAESPEPLHLIRHSEHNTFFMATPELMAETELSVANLTNFLKQGFEAGGKATDIKPKAAIKFGVTENMVYKKLEELIERQIIYKEREGKLIYYRFVEEKGRRIE